MVSFGADYQQSKSKSTPKDLTPMAFANLRGPTSQVLGGAITGQPGPGLGGIPDYSGPLSAPMTAAETATLGKISGRSEFNPFATDTNQLLTDTLQGKYVDPNRNPFLASYVQAAQRPLLTAFGDATLGDRAAFSNAGQRIQTSSPFATARARADEGLASALGDVSSRIYSPAYESERAIQAQAPTQAAAISEQERQGQLDRMVTQLQAESLPRLIEEQGITRGTDIYKERLAALQNMLGLGVAAGRPTVAQSSYSSSYGGGAKAAIG